MEKLESNIKYYKKELDKNDKEIKEKYCKHTSLVSQITITELEITGLKSLINKSREELKESNNSKEEKKKYFKKMIKLIILLLALYLGISSGLIFSLISVSNIPLLEMLIFAGGLSFIMAPLFPVAEYFANTRKYRKNYQEYLKNEIKFSEDKIIDLNILLEKLNEDLNKINNILNELNSNKKELSIEYNKLNSIKEQILASSEYQNLVQELYEGFTRKLDK